jgi:hypothetical protein
LATLKRVSFVRDAALPPTLLALEEAHGVRFETLAAARKKRPTLAPKAVTMVDVTPGELAQERWWPELRELYVLGFDCPLSELVKLPVARQLTALGLRDMLASVAADYFEMDCVKALPPSVERVVFEVYTGNTGLKVVLLRAGKRWRTELRPSKPLRPPSGYFGGDLAELIRPLRHHLADAAAVEVMSGVPEAFRELAR